MPTRGGAADKLGNRYEALWTIHQLLEIVEGGVRVLTLEPIDEDESRGVEFRVERSDGFHEYWSVKRQTAGASGWTPAILSHEDERGRSILGDLRDHVERDSNNIGVFASTQSASVLDELRSCASTPDVFKARLLTTALKSAFSDHVALLYRGDQERARLFLTRIRTCVMDETSLRHFVELWIRKLFRTNRSSVVDAAAVRGHLAELVLDHIHQAIERGTILRALSAKGFRLSNLAHDALVIDKIRSISSKFTEQAGSQMINGALLPLAGSEQILSPKGTPSARRLLVVGPAGGGKSVTLASIVESLLAHDVPVLTISFDTLPEGLLTTTELGLKFGLPESPVVSLDGVAGEGPSVLVCDQLDAVSMVSGRRFELLSLFDDLAREAKHCEGMSLIVGCREFDLEHDSRMRAMKMETSGYAVVNLKPLSPTQVDDALRFAGGCAGAVDPSLRLILTVPLHLWMFLTLDCAGRGGVRTRDQLFDRYWEDARMHTRARVAPRADQWTEVLDCLVTRLSERQELAAPREILDVFDVYAKAMASEHVLILADGKYRFFHEAFFDYAFARRFVAGHDRLVSFLLREGQPLFRRAQVRQVLAYLREHNRERYLEELSALLGCNSIRFYIKRLVFQWLSAVSEPGEDEWTILASLAECAPSIRSHIINVVANSPGWFDVLNSIGFFDAAFTSGDAQREGEAVWLVSLHRILESRSERVATLISRYRKPGAPWDNYLRHLCRFGDTYYSPEMFELFLSLVDDGSLDTVRPEIAVNDNWWSCLHQMADKHPSLATLVIAHWFDRRVRMASCSAPTEDEGFTRTRGRYLQDQLNRGGDGGHVIQAASCAADAFVEQMLPRVAALVAETSEVIVDERLLMDGVWCWRSFGEDLYRVHDALLTGLARALEELAKTAPNRLQQLVEPYEDRPHDTIAFLLLRAWTAAPEVFADRLADYLSADQHRLRVGYDISGGGWVENLVSMNALKAASASCSPERYAKLESAVLQFTDASKGLRPQHRGLRQLRLLKSLETSRLGPEATRLLERLERKFPDIGPARPRSFRMAAIGSPIPPGAQAKMTDEQWLGAMTKYAGSDNSSERHFELKGGERELANALEERTKLEPRRFVALAVHRMLDDLPASYFDAIVRGVSHCAEKIPLEEAVDLIRRTHLLPNRPCGRWIAWLIREWGCSDWPEDVIDAVAWYAMNDPDPSVENWRGESPCHGGDPHGAGINSTRGAMAGAIARLLRDDTKRFERLRDSVRSLVDDPSVAVRSCAVEVLLAALNVDTSLATSWFMDCVSLDPVLLGTPHVERFIHYCGHSDYQAIRPVIVQMLDAGDPKVVETAARQVCLLALTTNEANKDADRVRSGTTVMRKAAADVYSANVAHEQVGATCRRILTPFFGDSDEGVRAEAASAFHHLAKMPPECQAALLVAFLDSAPGPIALEPVVYALEDSPVQLPDLVCTFAEMCFEAFKGEAGDIRTSASAVATDLSKIVIRLYSQTNDPTIRSRCLDLIDKMEQHSFSGLSKELERMDR